MGDSLEPITLWELFILSFSSVIKFIGYNFEITFSRATIYVGFDEGGIGLSFSLSTFLYEVLEFGISLLTFFYEAKEFGMTFSIPTIYVWVAEGYGLTSFLLISQETKYLLLASILELNNAGFWVLPTLVYLFSM